MSPVHLLALLLVASPASAEDGLFQPLHSPDAQATSYLQTNWNRFTENYHPTYVLDDNPNTAWVEGVDGLGEGQVLTLPLSRVRQADEVRVRIRNGYQKSPALLLANAAPDLVRIRLMDRQGAVAGEVEVNLAKAMDWQDILISVGGREFERLQLEVLSVHEGSRYRDTCISDVRVDVHGSGPYSSAMESKRLETAKTWIAERVQAAAYFASQPADYLFVSNAFHTVETQQHIDTVTPLLQAARVDLAALTSSSVWYRSSRTRPAVWLPEGGDDLSAIVGALTTTERAWFEADEPIASHVHEVGDGDNEDDEWWVYNDRISWADEAKSTPTRVLGFRKDISNGRGLWVQETSTLLDYDEQGRLTRAYIISDSQSDLDSPSMHEQLYQLEWNGADIVGWTLAYRSAERAFSMEQNTELTWWMNEEIASYQYSDYRPATP